MGKGKKVLLALGCTTVLGGLAFLLSLSDLATGRERIAPLFFPYAYLVTRTWVDDNLFRLLMLGQFPLYGIVAMWSCAKGQAKGIVATILLHILFALSVGYLISIERQYRVCL